MGTATCLGREIYFPLVLCLCPGLNEPGTRRADWRACPSEEGELAPIPQPPRDLHAPRPASGYFPFFLFPPFSRSSLLSSPIPVSLSLLFLFNQQQEHRKSIKRD